MNTPKQIGLTLQSHFDAFSAPYIRLEQGVSGLWHPATAADRALLMECDLQIPHGGLATDGIDSVLDRVSERGYWLETAPVEFR